MKKSFQKLIVSMIVVAAINLLIVTIGNAGNANYYGITTIVASKSVNNVSGTQYWDAKLWSKTKLPVTDMDDIGYSWWTVRERCDGIPIQQVQPTPHSPGGSSYYAATTIVKADCDGTRQGQSLGNHVFYKWPYGHKYLYVQASNWVP